MASFSGTVGHNDLEGGFWELRTNDGKSYQLRGGDQALRVEGLAVVVDGKIDTGAMGIAMSGPILDVVSWKPA